MQQQRTQNATSTGKLGGYTQKKKRVEDGKNFGMRLSVRERGFFYVELEIMHRQLDERQREAQKEKIKYKWYFARISLWLLAWALRHRSKRDVKCL